MRLISNTLLRIGTREIETNEPSVKFVRTMLKDVDKWRTKVEDQELLFETKKENETKDADKRNIFIGQCKKCGEIVGNCIFSTRLVKKTIVEAEQYIENIRKNKVDAT